MLTRRVSGGEKFDVGSINKDERTIELSLSSERPVMRVGFEGPFLEVLDHSPSAVDLSRAEFDSVPLLLNHGQLIGKLSNIRLESGKLRATARFSRSQIAEDVFQEIQDGIRTAVSIGYKVKPGAWAKDGLENGVQRIRIKSWELLEGTIADVPADPSVGVGRAEGYENYDLKGNDNKGESEMFIKGQPRDQVRTGEGGVTGGGGGGGGASGFQGAQAGTHFSQGDMQRAMQEERQRVNELMALGQINNRSDLAQKYITEGKSPAEFTAEITRSVNARAFAGAWSSDPGTGSVKVNQRDAGEFRFCRAIEAISTGNWNAAPLELQIHQETMRAFGKKEIAGFYLPTELLRSMLVRDNPPANVVTTADGKGGGTIATELRSFADLLRDRLVVRQMGAEVLSGLSSNVAIPKVTQGAEAVFVAENTEFQPSTMASTQIPLNPKTVATYLDISRKLTIQSSLSVENWIRRELAGKIARAIDRAALMGDGTGANPRGIMSYPATKAGTLGSAALNYKAIIDLETAVADKNADLSDRLGYLTTPSVRGYLKQKEVAKNTAVFCWTQSTPQDGALNGYPAMTSNILRPKTAGNKKVHPIIYGAWDQIIIGEFGTLQVLVNPYSLQHMGSVRISSVMEVDIAIRYEEAFAFYDDVDVTITD